MMVGYESFLPEIFSRAVLFKFFFIEVFINEEKENKRRDYRISLGISYIEVEEEVEEEAEEI